MKTLGIIGGLGPESTIDYYGKIIALYRERTGDGSYPQFIVNSVNLKKGLDFMDANNLPGMADYLVEEIGKLARAGATFGLISANTPHIVFDEVASRSPIPLDQYCRSNLCSGESAKVETARPLRDALHNAGNFLSEGFLARGNRASRARLGGSDLHSRQVPE